MKIWRNALLLLVVAGAAIPHSRHESEAFPVITHTFRNGDLIFRKGTGIFSDFFTKAGDRETPYSHVGLAFVDNGKVLVIHTEASELTGEGFAKIDRIEEFLDKRNSSQAAVYRLKNESRSYGENAVEAAIEYVNQKTPFDVKFDLTTENALYCTELAYRAYKKAGLDITDKLDTISFRLADGHQYQREVVSIRSILDSQLLTKMADLN